MRFAIFPLLSLLATSAFASAPCANEESRNLDIDIAGLKTLEAQLGSTDLQIEGVAGLNRIEVRSRACASDKNRLASVTLEQKREGDTLTLIPRQAEHQTYSWFGSDYAYLDFHVRVPATLAVHIVGASGDVDAKSLASLDYSGHSGDLVAKDIAGTLRVETHSGDVKVRDIGSLDVVRSGSGDISATDVQGDVHVGRVGSGDLVFEKIDKGVHVESVGSGDVTVTKAGGTVQVDSIGSGDVSASDVGGDFIVKSAGSGDVHHANVKGKVSVPKGDD